MHRCICWKLKVPHGSWVYAEAAFNSARPRTLPIQFAKQFVLFKKEALAKLHHLRSLPRKHCRRHKCPPLQLFGKSVCYLEFTQLNLSYTSQLRTAGFGFRDEIFVAKWIAYFAGAVQADLHRLSLPQQWACFMVKLIGMDLQRLR